MSENGQSCETHSETPAAPSPKRPTPVDIAIGARIATYHKAYGLSQAGLAKFIGVAGVQIERCETGADRTSAGRLGKIAEFLDVSPAALYGKLEAVPTASENLPLLGVPGAMALLERSPKFEIQTSGAHS